MKKIQKIIVIFSMFCIILIGLNVKAEVIEISKPPEVTDIRFEGKGNILSTSDILKISASVSNIDTSDIEYSRISFGNKDNEIIVEMHFNPLTNRFEGEYNNKIGMVEGIYRFQLLSILKEDKTYYRLPYYLLQELVINNNCANNIHEVYADSWENYSFSYGDKNCLHKATQIRKCNICGQIADIKYFGPTITDWTIMKDSGIKVRKCYQCGAIIEQRSIPKSGELISASSGSCKVTSVGNTVEYQGSKSVKNVIVPETVTYDGITYKVTSIAPGAFKNNKKLTKVTIGSNVKTIGKQAFYGCKNLKSVTIKSKYLTTKSIGAKAFTKAGSKNYKKLVVKLPKSKKKAYVKLLEKKGLSSKAKIK